MEEGLELLITHLIKDGYLKTTPIIDAFEKIDRKDFMAPEYKGLAYIDEAFSIGYGQTISQPLTVAFMFELLQPEAGDKILDVGSGSGWTTALLADLVGERGRVIGIERISELVEFGKENLAKYKFKSAEILQAEDGIGFSKEAPYDKILVSAAAESIPQELINQLKVGGRMVIPINHSIWKMDRISEKKIRHEEYYGFSFVPLIKN